MWNHGPIDRTLTKISFAVNKLSIFKKLIVTRAGVDNVPFLLVYFIVIVIVRPYRRMFVYIQEIP